VASAGPVPPWCRLNDFGAGASKEAFMLLALPAPLRKWFVALMLAAGLLVPACDRSGSGRARPDAANSSPSDAQLDLGGEGQAPDATGPFTSDAAPLGNDAVVGADAASPRDAVVADLRPSDLSSPANPDGPAVSDGVSPPNNGSVSGLTAVAANTTVGLDWPRAAGATGYHVYWATAPGVSKSSQMLESSEPAFVHRGLDNGTTYYHAVAAVTAAGEGDLSDEASATPGGEWVLEELGAGDFDDVMTGGRVSRLAVQDRIQIALFGEGYLDTELSKLHDLGTHNGTRANDVDRWVDEVFAIEPYKEFRSAFVIWYLPRASAAHLGEGSTAFGVTVSGGAVATVTAVAAPLFSALDASGGDAFAFPPASPVVNHVAAFLLYDPARGRAGVSGLTTSLTSPDDRNQRISAAFGVGHAHEFTHAFTGLRDEYIETSNSAPRTASETSNVSPTNTCSTLPWAHLLAGAGINTTEGLVGAFGSTELGYHAELKCLLNGTHDNGEFFCQATSSGSYPSLTLRTDDRLCNFCREITTYRVFDKTRILPGSNGFATWKSQYRGPFYQRFGFKVPTPVPQTLKCPEDSAARPVFQDCAP
jgi:hypothetical protein